MFTIKAPNEEYARNLCGVQFIKGIATTEDKNAAAWFSGRPGFEVTSDESPAEVFVCSVCQKEYKTEKGLADHMAEKHPET